MYSPDQIKQSISDREPVTLYFDYEDSSPERILVNYNIGVFDEGLEDTLVLYEDDAVTFLKEELDDLLEFEKAYSDYISSLMDNNS